MLRLIKSLFTSQPPAVEAAPALLLDININTFLPPTINLNVPAMILPTIDFNMSIRNLAQNINIQPDQPNTMSFLESPISRTIIHQAQQTEPNSRFSFFNPETPQPTATSTRSTPSSQPISRLPQGMKEDPLTKRLHTLNNASITVPIGATFGVYITTNEEGQRAIAEQLTLTQPVSNGCHIGFSGWHNFDIMALRNSSRGIICDANPKNALFLHATLNILRNSASRDYFISKMVEYVSNQGNQDDKHPENNSQSINFMVNYHLPAESDSPADEIKAHLLEQSGWLINDERFHHIKRLAETDKITLITEDICTTATFITLRKILRDNAVQVDSLYLSNISNYMQTQTNRDAFVSTVEALSEPSTLIIDACAPYEYDPLAERELYQRLISPTHLLDSTNTDERETLTNYFFQQTPTYTPSMSFA